MHSGISSVAFQPNTHSCDKTHTCICPGCQGCQASDNFRKEHWSPDHMSSFRTDDSACVWMCVCVCVCVFARVVCVYLLFYFPVWRIGLRTSCLQTDQRSVQCTSAGQKFSDSCGGIRPKLGGIKNIVKTVSEELVPRNKHILLI